MKLRYSIISITLICFCVFITDILVAQSIAINKTGDPPNDKAILDIQSKTKGVFIPRLTSLERTDMSLGSSDPGMIVYDMDLKNFMFYTGADWVFVGEGASLWEPYSTFGARLKNNANVGLGFTPSFDTKLRIESGAQKGVHISNNGGTNNFALSVENEIGTAAFFGTGAAFFSGYPVTPTAVRAVAEGNTLGVFSTSKGTEAAVYAQSQGTGPALDAYSFGTGMAGIFRNGNVGITGGDLGVGTSSPSNRLHVIGESGNANPVANVTVSYVGTSDVRAIQGYSVPAPGFGMGGQFTGGYRGVYGVGNGGDYSGSASVIGVYGHASGTGSNGTRIGLYGTANGGATNWAGYFNGNTYCSGDLRIGNQAGATGYRVSVDGKIMAEEIRVENSSTWPDYVFADDYDLKPLSEVKEFIQKESHLPGIPSADEIEKDGIIVGQMQNRMLEKIEELTLYIITMNEQILQLQSKIVDLEKNK